MHTDSIRTNLLPRVALIALAALLALAVVADRPARSQTSGGLAATVQGIIELEPDTPAATATWLVTVTNTGAPAWYDGQYAPSGISLLLDGNHTGFTARDGAGRTLEHSIRQLDEGLSEASIHFGRSLSTGESFDLAYSYSLLPGAGGLSLLRPGYVTLLAQPEIFAGGGFELVSIIVSAPASYGLLVQGQGCDRVAAPAGRVAYECIQEEPGAFAVGVEAVDPSRRVEASEIVAIDGREIELILRYLRGDEAWAAWARDIVIRGMPIIGEIMGVSYSGPPRVRVSQRGRQEIFGAAGVAACDSTMCATAVEPSAGEQVLLHELVHMWHRPYEYETRWLAEGQAEFVSHRAAQRMGYPTHTHGPAAPDEHTRTPFPLDTWGSPVDFLDSPEDILQREYDGYHWSYLFFETLVESFGMEPFQMTNAYLDSYPTGSVDSRAYMDALEDIGDAAADIFFMEMVFPDDQHTALGLRRQARDRLMILEMEAGLAPELPVAPIDRARKTIQDWNFEQALELLDVMEPGFHAYLEIQDEMLAIGRAAEDAGLPYPLPFKQRMDTWDFAPLASTAHLGLPAIEAYLEARRAVGAPRSLWTQIGLLGRNPESRLRQASDAFGWASFEESIQHSQSAVAMIDGAGSVAVRNMLIGAAAVVAFLFVAAAILLWPSRDPAHGEDTPSPA